MLDVEFICTIWTLGHFFHPFMNDYNFEKKRGGGGKKEKKEKIDWFGSLDV